MGHLTTCEQFRSITTRNIHPSENPICNICIATLSVIPAVATFHKTPSLERRACSPTYLWSCPSWTSRRCAPVPGILECLGRRGQEDDAARCPPADCPGCLGGWRRRVEGVCSAPRLMLQRQTWRNPGFTHPCCLASLQPMNQILCGKGVVIYFVDETSVEVFGELRLPRISAIMNFF